MDRPKWAEILPNDIYKRVQRMIKAVPGFGSYIRFNDKNNMLELVHEYASVLSYGNLLTPGIQTNLEMISDIINRCGILSPVSIAKWTPLPVWARNLNFEELEYLDNFIIQVSDLPAYLKENTENSNLTYLIIQFQKEHCEHVDRSSHECIILEAIKERYNRFVAEKKEGLYLVDNSLIINDKSAILEFLNDAKNNFFYVDLYSHDCKEFLEKYSVNFNPYTAFEIVERLIHYYRFEESIPFIKHISTCIFASPNLYWNNKESIYACAIISYTLVEHIGLRNLLQMLDDSSDLVAKLLQNTFLLLSRVIYWKDVQNEEEESYSDKLLPINVQHKLRAYQCRSDIALNYYPLLQTDIPQSDFYLMSIADMWSAHLLTFKYHILGEESFFKQEANRRYLTLRIPTTSNQHETFTAGWKILDSASQDFYKSYREGKYFLDYRQIKNLVNRDNFIKNKQDLHLSQIINVDISKTPLFNKSIAYKKDYKAIKEYLENNGVKFFYHFTEASRIESMIRNGGILSYKQCIDNNIVIPVTEDMAKSRDIDAKLGLEDYARLSFCKHLPKVEIRKQTYKDMVLLWISTDVALYENTEFSNIEATQEYMEHGSSLEDLKKVKIDVTQRDSCLESDPDYWAFQAEVMVKGKVPLHCILNIENPEIL